MISATYDGPEGYRSFSQGLCQASSQPGTVVQLPRRRRTRKSFGFPGFRVHFRVVDLTRTLGQPEGKTLEFKRDLSSPAGVMRAVVAFANTAGGTVIIGVDDGSRHVRGVSNPVELEERLSNMISDTIRPRLVPDIEVLPWRRTHLVAVHVYPSPGRPYFLEREGVERGTYVRVGSTNRRADRDLIEELRRFSRGESFDEQAMPDLDSDAIDFRAASESFSELRKLKRSDLTTLNLVTTHQRRKVPTVGGILLFGVDRARHFPDAYIQAGRFAGTDKAKIADHIEIRSYPVTAIEEAIGFVQKHALRAAEIGALRRKDRFTVPPVAVREAVVNAVVHADYAQRGAPIRISIFDDRLEVENPGLLPFGLTVEDLRQGVSKLRNGGRPSLPRTRSDRALGQRNPAHDRSVPGRWPAPAPARGDRHAVPRHPEHGTRTCPRARPHRRRDPRQLERRRRTLHPADRQRDQAHGSHDPHTAPAAGRTRLGARGRQ